MDPSNGKASNFERQSSVRRSVRLSTGNGATEDDDYDLSAMMVADGFRPSDNAGPGNFASPSHLQQGGNDRPSTPANQAPQLPPLDLTPQRPSSSSKPSLDQNTEMRNRPSSISKPPRSHDSLALRNDGTSASAASGTHVARASSMSSDGPVMRVESPYRGPSGPSHPYQMYPQRTMSVATTSTTAAAAAAIIPEDRSYTGPTGPTHPYALYTQNTVPTGEPAGEQIPLGFNNMGGTYQRQIGPDGEEAGDMIGPLGHVEELPPYTRYPENSYVPMTSTTAAAVTTTGAATTAEGTVTITAATDASPTAEPTSPSRSIAGAGGIGIATRDPEFSSTEDDLGMARTRPSVRSQRSELSHHDVNTAARDIAEKPPANKWQRRATKKLWGIVPYWAICLLTVGLILMGIIMGAVIGTLLTRHKKPPEDSATPSTTADVQYLTAVPTDLAPMVTGHYGLPPFQNTPSSQSCFNDTSQTKAWSCDMPFSYYNMDVTKNLRAEKDYKAYQIVMNPNNRTRSEFIYGTQPPSITEPVQLSLVIDTYEAQRGPAWWATMNYNKTVIVAEGNFPGIVKRGWDEDDDGHFRPPPQFKKKSLGAKEGDKPWICTWPNVALEIFIYPKQNSSSAVPTATTSGASTAETSTSDYEAPPPSYPKVLKMVELRYLKSKKNIASCRQVEIINNGKDCKPATDKNGNAIEVTIVENYPKSQKLQQTQRYSQIPKRWYVRELLSRSDSLELTDCGCLWWST